MRKDGKFVGVDGTVPEGQGIVMAHLNECHELLEMVRFCSQLCGKFADYVIVRAVETVHGRERRR